MGVMNSTEPASGAAAPTTLIARGLTVLRGERLLFEDLSFTVGTGGVLLLRGANGVGKSTLLLALAGIVRPDLGDVVYTVDGQPAERATELHLLGYQSGIKSRLTVSENLTFWRHMYGATGLSVHHALQELGIAGLAELEAGYLSSGQNRRLALARLLASHRSIWLLDEPMATLDAEGEALLGRLIDRHRERGGIVVIATHHDLTLSNPSGIETLILGGAT
jgi:heme exporter protein A